MIILCPIYQKLIHLLNTCTCILTLMKHIALNKHMTFTYSFTSMTIIMLTEYQYMVYINYG
jgi:hypothetical protein